MGSLFGKSGGYSTKAMEDATAKSLALQEKIYDQTRSDVQPWYQAGSGAIGKLSDLLGISGGSVMDRQQVYNQLLPQYTSQQTTSAGTPQLVDRYGRIVNESNLGTMYQGSGADKDLALVNLERLKRGDYAGIKQDNMSILNQPTTGQNVDYAALNKAVEERLAGQGLPSGYGSLLERFDMSKFQEDPGYQFSLEQGQKALERQMAAQGDTYSPRAAKALAEYNQGMAAQQYQTAYDRYNNDQNSIYNRLMGVSGSGQQATSTMAGAGQNYANQGTNLYTSLANAQTAAAQAKASQPSMFSQIMGTVGGTIFSGMTPWGSLGSYMGSSGLKR